MSILFLPMLACILLVGIHVYFGSFILRRGIIFVDLALAQWAALGYVVGHLLDVHHPFLLFILAFGFTVIPALLLTLLKPIYRQNNLQEAVIGVIYVCANTLAIGLISFSGMESYHFQEMLAGNLLFIETSELIFTYLSYILIALIVFRLHQNFVSSQSLIWDFVFYLLFGWVVTSSVKLVGVLLVFSYLLLPLLSVYLIAPQLKGQLIYGWLIGGGISLMGLVLSLYIDLPPSIVIIGLLIMTWSVITITHQLLKSNQ